MRRIIYVLSAAALLFSSCKPKSKNTNGKNTDEDAGVVHYAQLLGSYVGTFGDNKITLLISKAVKDTVEGRTIVGGNDRPFIGTIQFSDGKYSMNAKEPGDDKNDGVFDMSFDEASSNTISGSWQPMRNDATVQGKHFSLDRKSFVYKKDVGYYPEASERLLTDDDVSNLLKSDLEQMRNEIFARHGYCFKRKASRELFENKDWYIPHSVDVRGDLTDIEKKNITRIKRFEKYAAETDDEFGR
ncbi:MAG: YARHG domain-containing protein [Bacteroidetes bacterium]|nr:YARHG domain-containing protein [Bacteroidota bacterium]